MEHSFDWVLSCIESSRDGFQFTCCHTLIELFIIMYKEEGKDSVVKLKIALYDQQVKHSVEV